MNKVLYFIIAYGMILGVSESFCEDQMSKRTTPPTLDYHHKPDTYWKKVLPPKAYNICRKKGTEAAHSGQYDNFYEEGTYYCACCGGDFPLFASKAKFDSKTGWPSFYEPISSDSVDLVNETSWISRFLGAEVEVKCKRCGSHLGHVFKDGPAPTHERYCMNSLALRFVGKDEPVQRTFSDLD